MTVPTTCLLHCQLHRTSKPPELWYMYENTEFPAINADERKFRITENSTEFYGNTELYGNKELSLKFYEI